MNLRTGLDMLGYLVEPRREDEPLDEYRERLLQVGREVLNRSFLSVSAEDRPWREARQEELRGRTGDPNLQILPHPDPSVFDSTKFTYDELNTRERPFRWPLREARGEAPVFGEAEVQSGGVGSTESLSLSVADDQLYIEPGYVLIQDRLYYVYGSSQSFLQHVPPGTEETVLLPWHISTTHAHIARIIDEDSIELEGVDGHKHELRKDGTQLNFQGPHPHTHEITPVEPNGPAFAHVSPSVVSTSSENGVVGGPLPHTNTNLLPNGSFESPITDWTLSGGAARTTGEDASGNASVELAGGTLSYAITQPAFTQPTNVWLSAQAKGEVTLKLYVDGTNTVEKTWQNNATGWHSVGIGANVSSGESVNLIEISGPAGSFVDVVALRTAPAAATAEVSRNAGVYAVEVPFLRPVMVETLPDSEDHEHSQLVAPENYWDGSFVLIGEDHNHIVVDGQPQMAAGHTHTLETPTRPDNAPLYPQVRSIEDEVVNPSTSNPHVLEMRVEQGWTVARVPGGIPGYLLLTFPEGETSVEAPPADTGLFGLTPPLPADHIHVDVRRRRAGYPLIIDVRVEDENTGGIPYANLELEWMQDGANHRVTKITSFSGAASFEIPTDRMQSSLILHFAAEGVTKSQTVDLLGFGEPGGYGFDYGEAVM